MNLQNVAVWRTLLLASTLVFLFSLSSLPSLYENISGDNIPNRPQGEPPIVYRWDLAAQRIVLAAISLMVAIFSFRRIKQL